MQGQSAAGGLAVDPTRANLFKTCGDLVGLLRETVSVPLAGAESPAPGRDPVLDAFLFAAGLSQILEDYLERDVLGLTRAAPYLRPLVGPVGPVIAGVVSGAGAAGLRFRARSRLDARVHEQEVELSALIGRLADLIARRVIAGEPDLGYASPTGCLLDEAVQRLLAGLSTSPTSLQRTVLRLPNCFHSFDQQPADCLRLVERFAERWPERDRPVLVLGLRTSGSYLAPLYAAFLRESGYIDVSLLTIRPGRSIRRARPTMRKLGARQALGLVVDDAPRTGRQFAMAAEILHAHRISPVLALQQISDGDAVPEVLARYPAVVLPWRDWEIHRGLDAAAVRQVLERIPELRVLHVRRTDVCTAPRGHVKGLYAVELRDPTTGEDLSRTLCVEGVGLGYFGQHALAVAAAVRDLVPPVFAVQDGLLYRLWMEECSQLTAGRVRDEPAVVAARIAGYVEARSRRLPLPLDASLDVKGNDAAWELAAHMFGETFGRAKPFVRPVTNQIAKRLLEAQRPAVIDGATSPWHWFGTESSTALKVDFHGKSFATDGILSCDPVLDLAQAAAAARAAGVERFDEMLRQEYADLTSTTIGEERWLVYRLLHLMRAYTDLLRAAAEPGADARSFERMLEHERLMADVHRSYVEGLYLQDLQPVDSGPLCAIDIDGVLETRWTSYPAIDPSGALALRRLNRHGYRALLATGRSANEVRARCLAYRLTGGVAEYGSAIYVSDNDEIRPLVHDADRVALAEVAEVVSRTEGMFVDPTHQHSVRVHTIDRRGRRAGMTASDIREALMRAGVDGRIRCIPGELQTDFIASDVDKGRGLLALADALGVPSGGAPLLRLAIGDTDADVPMLVLAARPLAPANAVGSAREYGNRLSRPGPAGLLQAVRSEIGHSSCRMCRTPANTSEDARLMIALLGLIGAGRSGKVSGLVSLTAHLAGAGGARRPSRNPTP